jgi:hypothetical protein
LVYTRVAAILFGLNDKLDWEIGLTLALGQTLGREIASHRFANKGEGNVIILFHILVLSISFKLWFYN